MSARPRDLARRRRHDRPGLRPALGLAFSHARPGDDAETFGRHLRPTGEVVLCGAVAAAAASAFVLLLPRGGDLAAHLYRTGLVRHGILVWDNLWFAGQYPLASYSLLYYPVAAVIGNAALGIGGVAASAAIFASVALREWRSVGRWPARAFAVLLTGQAFTAAYPYDVGVCMLLATLWALQRGRLVLAVTCTVLTLGFSPLAFLFLVLALVATFLRHRRVSRQALAVGAAATVAAGVQLSLLVLMPTPGLVYPYGIWPLLAGFCVAGLGVAVALLGNRDWPLASLFLVWAGASIAFYVVPSPVGHNLARASVFAFPLVLVGAARAGFRPRWLVTAALVAALASNVLPYTAMISNRSSNLGARASFWRPVLSFLAARHSPEYRVEVVPTANHWEAYFVPQAGFALARGWYRQLDIADNPLLYAATLTPADYRAWLRARAVRYVVLPHLPLEAIDAARESSLLRSGASGLREIWNGPSASIYELPDATPILTGPGTASVDLLGSARIEGRVSRPGTYFLRARFDPFWVVTRGSLCLARTKTAMTRVEVRRAGAFTIRALESPAEVFTAILDGDQQPCSLSAPKGRG